MSVLLTLTQFRPIIYSCRNQSNDLHCKSIDWLLYEFIIDLICGQYIHNNIQNNNLLLLIKTWNRFLSAETILLISFVNFEHAFTHGDQLYLKNAKTLYYNNILMLSLKNNLCLIIT